MSAAAVHHCSGIGCEYCAAVDRIRAEEREMARKATPKHRTKKATSTLFQQPLATADGPFVAAPGNLKTAKAAYDFVTAGNAYFTVRSMKTGTRYTFRVSAVPKNENCTYCRRTPCACLPKWFVGLLTGPENTSDYSYLGMICSNQFRLTRASKMNEQSLPVKAFRWVWGGLVEGKLPPQTEIWHEGKCGRCGRTLTVPESIESGIGPVCEGKL